MIEYNIKYIAKIKPEVHVEIKSVTDGVYLIYIDSSEYIKRDYFTISDCEWEELYFSDRFDNVSFCVSIKFGNIGYLFGDVSKNTYNGTFYEYDKYCEIMGIKDRKSLFTTRRGKKYKKVKRHEKIEAGAMHSYCGGELVPVMNPNTIGDVPASFSDEREFYNPIKEK